MNKTYELDEILREQAKKEKERANANAEIAKKAADEKQIEEIINSIKIAREENKEEEQKGYVVAKNTVGTKTKGFKEAISSKKGRIATALGAVALTSVIFLTARGCKNDDNNKDIEITTTTTVTSELEDVKPVEITTTTTKEFTTTTAADITMDTTAPVETTTVTTVNEDELIVTQPDEEENEILITPEETTADTTVTAAPVVTTVAETTTQKVEEITTTTTKAAEEAPVEIKPIMVKNLEAKASILKDAALLAGYSITDELAINTVRILHSDYIEHDGYKEITAQKYDESLRLLTNIGSTNETLMNLAYLTGQIKLEGKFYIPAEIFPEEQQEYIRKFNNLTQDYVDGLNDAMYVPGEIDYDTLIENSVANNQAFLDLYKDITTNPEYVQGVINFDEYLQLLEKRVNGDVLSAEEKFQLAEQYNSNKSQVDRTKAYMTYLNKVVDLVNEPEYAKMHSAKLGILVNVTPALLSGVDNNNYDITAEKVQNIGEVITSSVDDIRETMIKANRLNNRTNTGKKIDQKEVLEAYIEEATQRNEEEAKLFGEVFGDIKSMASSYVKTR